MKTKLYHRVVQVMFIVLFIDLALSLSIGYSNVTKNVLQAIDRNIALNGYSSEAKSNKAIVLNQDNIDDTYIVLFEYGTQTEKAVMTFQRHPLFSHLMRPTALWDAKDLDEEYEHHAFVASDMFHDHVVIVDFATNRISYGATATKIPTRFIIWSIYAIGVAVMFVVEKKAKDKASL